MQMPRTPAVISIMPESKWRPRGLMIDLAIPLPKAAPHVAPTAIMGNSRFPASSV